MIWSGHKILVLIMSASRKARARFAYALTHQGLNRDLPRPDVGPKIGPFPIKKRAKTSQNSISHSQFLSSTFW